MSLGEEATVFVTWDQIDEELDRVEADNLPAIAAVFERFKGCTVMLNGRRTRVNPSNFSRHVGVPRHHLVACVQDMQEAS